MIIKITQTGGERQNLPLIENATDFFIKKLFTEKQKAKIDNINIKLTILTDAAGECWDDITFEEKFLIQIMIDRREALHNIISTIAHELVHAKQIVSGDLISSNILPWYYKNKCYGVRPYHNLEYEAIYKKLPWEKEAYDKETILSKAFFKYYYENNY